jgi:hypothetical protein
MILLPNSCEQIITQFPSKSLFQFNNEDHIYVLIGYPHWRAFILTPKSNLRLEVFPRINLVTKKIEFLEEPAKDNGEERIYLKVEDEQILNSYLEKEREFFCTIPEEITNRVKVFSDSHWEIIKAITVYGHNFITLIDSNPVLAYLLVNLDKINPSFSLYIDNSYLERLITEKQKEILGLADFPATRRMVKIFSKFDPKLVDVECLKSFQLNLMSRPERQEKIFKVLSHSRIVNTNLLHIIAFYPGVLDILTSRATQELIKSDLFLNLFDVLKTMSAKAHKWKIEFKIEKLNVIDKAEENLNAAIQKRKDVLNNFPPPPIPDGEGITTIKTVAQQTSWAKRQQNCIRGYVNAVMTRRCYLYKVIFGKEEATLEIKIQRDGLRFGQLKGFKNQRVSKELWVHVKRWFDDYIRLQDKVESKKYKMLEMEFENSI